MTLPLRVLVVGCGHMGASHARAYQAMPGFDLVGLVSRGETSRATLSEQLGGIPHFSSYHAALDAVAPDVVSINTYPDSHASLALAAIHTGCHVFCEKPLAVTVSDATAVIAAAAARDVKLVVGYILRVHPAWERFVEIARTLGKPLVMRMNLNQQSRGSAWTTHLHIMDSMSPLVDCGVHYVDVMCQMTGATPIRVSAIGARLTDELPRGMYNYGQLQVTFDDGSVGWYEAGWGPMMSEVAYFVKDVVGPRGAVSIARDAGSPGRSDAVEGHTTTEQIRVHYAARDAGGDFARPDEIVRIDDEPTHQDLCEREQAFLLRAIRDDLDLRDHWRDAVNSLRIVLAADESVRSGQMVTLLPSP